MRGTLGRTAPAARIVLALVTMGWRHVLRDRFAVAGTFLLPVVLAMLMVDVHESSDDAQPAPVGVLAGGDGEVSREILRRLDRSGVIELRRYDDRVGLERAIRRRQVAAGVVVPATVDDLDRRATATVHLLGQPTVAAPGGVRAAVEAAVARVSAALHVGRALDPAAPTGAALARGAAELAGTPAVEQGGARASRPGPGLVGPAHQAVAGVLVLFVFTNTVIAGTAVADLREGGILARAHTTGASPLMLAIGLVVNFASYALFLATSLVTVGWLLFDIRWSSWTTTLAVLVTLALAAGGLGTLVGGLIRSSELGVAVGGPLGFLLALLGGALWPLEVVDPGLARLGHLTPHAWAINALRETGQTACGLADVGHPLGVLAGCALVLTIVGGLRVAALTRV